MSEVVECEIVMTTDEMLHHLSNVAFDDLDAAIQTLQRARKSRAEMRACVAFKPGDLVQFPWTTNKGYRTFVGTFKQVSKESGKVEIHKAKPAKSESGLGESLEATYIVDSAIVDHAESHDVSSKDSGGVF